MRSRRLDVKEMIRVSPKFLGTLVIDFARLAEKQTLSDSIGGAGGKLARGAIPASRSRCAFLRAWTRNRDEKM
ncbi:MAG TPA: hypothetical protein DDZ68_16770 [Parvularcula sp.]|nr:hypothetical protein [Parvularcula sp.]HBS31436.1 hypothetical protein [Parvularcula sp.]